MVSLPSYAVLWEITIIMDTQMPPLRLLSYNLLQKNKRLFFFFLSCQGPITWRWQHNPIEIDIKSLCVLWCIPRKMILQVNQQSLFLVASAHMLKSHQPINICLHCIPDMQCNFFLHFTALQCKLSSLKYINFLAQILKTCLTFIWSTPAQRK